MPNRFTHWLRRNQGRLKLLSGGFSFRGQASECFNLARRVIWCQKTDDRAPGPLQSLEAHRHNQPKEPPKQPMLI
ncbi:unnamed protein product [Mesocestoides corti]|uniref:FLYWCH-type domain-containing protein n=1 Tax=Mesocestoides corti TaxID=53468 RepID=A0A0R3UNJ5_MESCO|nr:unnamed protein product [Mesocestoides corti]